VIVPLFTPWLTLDKAWAAIWAFCNDPMEMVTVVPFPLLTVTCGIWLSLAPELHVTVAGQSKHFRRTSSELVRIPYNLPILGSVTPR
jgi:hypothetical protein